MSYIYAFEGSNGGYPLREDKDFSEYWDHLLEHHDCQFCGREYHEANLHQTNMGWCCIDCYNYLHTECKDEPDLPEIINNY